MISPTLDFLEGAYPGYPTGYSSLVAPLLSGMQSYTDNLIAYAKDLKAFGDTARQLISLVIGSKKLSAKEVSKAWLSLRYGDRLQISDTQELLQSMSQMAHVLETYGLTFLQGKARLTPDPVPLPRYLSDYSSLLAIQAYLMPKDYGFLMKVVRKAMEWDAWPTLGNTWDLIPLSFVVDWFVDLSSFLEKIDAAVYSLYLMVYSVIYSFKNSAVVSSSTVQSLLAKSGINLTVTKATCSFYRRMVTDSLPQVRFAADAGHFQPINVIDSVSLLYLLS